MYFADHGPPHFHAFYGGAQALIGIESLAVLKDTSHPEREVLPWNGQRTTR